MKHWEIVDPFFNKQPPKTFIGELKSPLHNGAYEKWNARNPASDEIEIKNGVKLIRGFNDPKNLLETSYDDFNVFLKVHGISDGEFPIRTAYRHTECFEAYGIEVGSDGCIVFAADTEGIRRALIFLEDEMIRREGPFLHEKSIQRKPFIKTRISRCFFSPTNRPPLNGEELADDIDYYPGEYLNRLMHEGINGIWIYTYFRDLLPSDIIPEYGRDYKRRIGKLNRTIEKCSRYGIKTYIFGVEPASTYQNPILLENHKELLGSKWGDDFYAFCMNTEEGIAYAEEASSRLFELAPELTGMIIITIGENSSHCGSNIYEIGCPRCKDKSSNQILQQTVAALERGAHSVKPEAEFISWPYGQRCFGAQAVIDSAGMVPPNVILMHNFEDLGEEVQLGRKRLAIDYWLSYIGPSEMFEKSAIAAKSIGNKVFAKLQVACSHEVASIPYVPVPGILYEKYKAMHALGIEGVMQCWYFGNYPSLMGKSAGELSFEPFFEEKDRFLEYLAGIYWGGDAVKAVKAWKCFEEGYRNFPINIAFSWYGPMHDAVVWPLHLIPENLPLAGTWFIYDAVGGDRIGECLLQGHDLDEAIILCEMMSKSWKKGVDLLEKIPAKENESNKIDQKIKAKALDYQFESGLDVLRFYQLREKLGYEIGDKTEMLDKMTDIVKREIEISQGLSELCKIDGSLGYHSEGEGYKYFPAKLEWRISLLKNLLQTEFATVRERIGNGLAPLEFYKGVEEGSKKYFCTQTDINKSSPEEFILEDGTIDDRTSWSAAMDDENLYLRISCKGIEKDDRLEIWPEFRLMWPYPPMKIRQNGKFNLKGYLPYYSIFGEVEEKEYKNWNINVTTNNDDVWETNISIKRNDIGFGAEKRPFRINLIRKNSRISKWIFSEFICDRLIFDELNHQEFGWIIF